MVKKYCYTLSNGGASESDDGDTKDELTMKNRKMIDKLMHYKNSIDTTFSDGTWDKWKKYTNDYELVFTSMDMHQSVSKYVPISRSFFKLWEILNYFEKHFSNDSSRCFFMAEGPGGFVEAYSKWRGNRLRNDDILVTTLINTTDKTVPSLRIPRWVSKSSKQFRTLYGPKKNGDICDLENMRGIVEEIGLNSCLVVTGDGGFDFSANFNDQEEMSTRLILCEVLLGLQIQKDNGSFVLKMYDLSLYSSFQLITLLQKCYKTVQIIKPRTSRPANSEKYLVCTGYASNAGMAFVPILVDYLVDNKENICIDVPIGILRAIVEFNSRFVMNQIMYIMKTMHYIKNKDDVHIDDIIKCQIKKAIKWCKKYNIPHHSSFTY
jgi:23S rRNA U2552 (ribose-2'-O)-methylase RlmE/FtsJ